MVIGSGRGATRGGGDALSVGVDGLPPSPAKIGWGLFALPGAGRALEPGDSV
jgi:hypothetical protein